jgi:hypothetical protein
LPSIRWGSGRWTHPPVAAVERGSDLLVTAAEGSDAWRTTSYGFVHDSEHALLAPFDQDTAVEVEFTAAFSQQFDQAGPFTCAPTRAGLTIAFHAWRTTSADAALH